MLLSYFLGPLFSATLKKWNVIFHSLISIILSAIAIAIAQFSAFQKKKAFGMSDRIQDHHSCIKAGVNLNFREKCDFLFFPENYPLLGIKVNFWKTFL